MKLGYLTPYENLRGFATTRPPLVVFMICMGLFAVVLLSLAYYVKQNEIRNPDISQDWNVFLENFAELEFCITGNNTDSVTTAAPPATNAVSTKSRARVSTTPAPTTKDAVTGQVLEYEGPRNYSVSLLLSVQPTREFLSIPHNVTFVSGSIYGRQLGLSGMAADELVNITAELPFEWNTTHCKGPPYGCSVINILTCVHFQASPLVFPSSRSPDTCEGLNETGIEYHAKVMAHKPSKTYPTYYCRSHPVIRINYRFNPTLTVWLSLHDKSVINLHLMNTSYFLFVMVVTLFCYALLKGKPNKSKITQTPETEGLTAAEA